MQPNRFSIEELSGELQPVNNALRDIAAKVQSGKRISVDEGFLLYTKAPLGWLALLAEDVKNRKSGNVVYYNKNVHLELTNICKNDCLFCSFSCKEGEEGTWKMTDEEIDARLREYSNKDISEIHVTGAVYPGTDIHDYIALLDKIRKFLPEKVHIKAFTAEEIFYVCKGHDYGAMIRQLKEHGLASLPGGGAEIFDETIRKHICPDKLNATQWLAIHEAAHSEGLVSNATMLYGHIENYRHRLEHMESLRTLQDKTGGFNAFIPLKFRNKNNKMQHIGEVNLIEEMRNYALSRIFLDNFDHIKAYWPMTGIDAAVLSLSFGVDDLDGTIDDTTAIYTAAGVEGKQTMTTDELQKLIIDAGKVPSERDSWYRRI